MFRVAMPAPPSVTPFVPLLAAVVAALILVLVKVLLLHAVVLSVAVPVAADSGMSSRPKPAEDVHLQVGRDLRGRRTGGRLPRRCRALRGRGVGPHRPVRDLGRLTDAEDELAWRSSTR